LLVSKTFLHVQSPRGRELDSKLRRYSKLGGRRLVRICEAGGRVLDPFAGSGTTLVAAQLEGFEAVGIEMTDQYTTVTRDRLTAL
ncbi:DNA methyltransferase, partial [Xanthomonas campestris]